MLTPQMLRTEFQKTFNTTPTLITRAPGRVNLIGEHTDYNDGFVLPMAIDRAVWMAARPRDDRRVQMVACDFDYARSEFALDAPILRDNAHAWSNYVRGVAWALQVRGVALVGADLVIRGDVPVGSGLSSSAALEVCAATMFVELARASISKVELARLCQQAENEFVGVKCGIMDQFASALAQENHALWIDCRDLSYRHIPLPRGAVFVVCDSRKRRDLANSAYNQRRAECERAARALGVVALRDVSIAEFTRRANELPHLLAKRARHVITENARVLAAITAAEQNDLAAFGKLMNESHASLRDDFEVSCAELDALVEIARAQVGCWGARLTGAGFGGCTVNLVNERDVPQFIEEVTRVYRARFGIAPLVYPCRAAQGSSKIEQ
ncbi:MAG: galactokinase [Anaerolineae bacterium]|nr:galactokinase [Anaerolineae bacterium]